MKPNHLFATLLAAAAVTACTGESRRFSTGLEEYAHEASTNSTLTSSTPIDSIPSPTLPPVTSQGIGPLRLGQRFDTLPRILPGLYDSIAATEETFDDEEFLAVEMFLNHTKTVEATAGGPDRRIYALTLIHPGPAINIDGTRVSIGTPRATIKSLAGLRPMPQSAEGFARMQWHGINLYLDADTVTAISLGEE